MVGVVISHVDVGDTGAECSGGGPVCGEVAGDYRGVDFFSGSVVLVPDDYFFAEVVDVVDHVDDVGVGESDFVTTYMYIRSFVEECADFGEDYFEFGDAFGGLHSVAHCALEGV